METDVAIGVGGVRAITVDHLQFFDREYATTTEDVCAEWEATKVRFVVAEDIIEEGIEFGVAEDALVCLVAKHQCPARGEEGKQIHDNGGAGGMRRQRASKNQRYGGRQRPCGRLEKALHGSR